MNCFDCGVKLDPILTFARPHGHYSKCEGCRGKAREEARKKRRARREALGIIFRSKDSEGKE